jgi:hypothetical protein
MGHGWTRIGTDEHGSEGGGERLPELLVSERTMAKRGKDIVDILLAAHADKDGVDSFHAE